MPIDVIYPHIVKEPDKPARFERQPRTRVSMIVRAHQEAGLSAQEIVRQYSYLSRAEVHSALAYYFDHQSEIDEEIYEENRLVEELSQRKQPPVVEKLRALKQGSKCR